MRTEKVVKKEVAKGGSKVAFGSKVYCQRFRENFDNFEAKKTATSFATCFATCLATAFQLKFHYYYYIGSKVVIIIIKVYENMFITNILQRNKKKQLFLRYIGKICYFATKKLFLEEIWLLNLG